MAKPSLNLVHSLRATAQHLKLSNEYQWGHMGSCNCGFLAQEITRLGKAEIHRRALQRYGDWNEQLNDYCPASGLLFDQVVDELLIAGLDIDDLKHLEKLSDPFILQHIASENSLRHNAKKDVIIYLQTWANLIEQDLLSHIHLPLNVREPILEA